MIGITYKFEIFGNTFELDGAGAEFATFVISSIVILGGCWVAKKLAEWWFRGG